ncbi:MAG: CotH kinase family protein [Dysgonamonadaceae bacterium]|nr:CotH kinase family protein [Dysgonamonadaceae bacterium]
MKRIWLYLIFFVLLFSTVDAQLIINEFMQSNIDEVRDDLQEFPDSWVELYNPSETAIDIYNYYISDKKDFNKGWRINEHAVVPAKGYLLIYCDEAEKGIHTSFRLESGNDGKIYFFDASGNELDKITNIPKQPAPNIAMGRTGDGSVLTYFETPTPGKPNSSRPVSELLPDPVFSINGGVYKSQVKLELSLPENCPQGVKTSDIRYTLDGSEPTSQSTFYSGSIIISSTKTVRAKIISSGFLSRRSLTHSYIVENKDFTLPIISVALNPEYLWDNEFGIYVKGNGKYGIIGNGTDYKANWNNDWRRPMNFEYFPSAGSEAALNQIGELRIAGGWSRLAPQKTLILYSNKRFGDNKRYDYQLFSEKPNQEIKSFMIRNSGNDFWWTHFRDAAIQLFMGKKVDIDYQAYQPAAMYINGQYWGIQNLRERSDEDFVLANYATEDIDMIEYWWGELKAGDKDAWNKLMNELRKPVVQRDMEWIMSQIDLDEFINYMILQIYVANNDFPWNNVMMWRPKSDSGKWRFVVKDTDFGLGIWGQTMPDYDSFYHNTSDDNDDMKLFNALLSQNSFRKDFYTRFAVYLGDILHNTATLQVIDSIVSLIRPEMNYHLLRWRDDPELWWRDINSWQAEVDKMKDWCRQRNPNIYSLMKSFFNLGKIIKTDINAGNLVYNGDIVLTINGIKLSNPVFDGYYYSGETFTVGIGSEVDHTGWEVESTIDGQTVKTRYPGKIAFEYTIPENCSTLIIRAYYDGTAISAYDSSNILIASDRNKISVSGLSGKSQIMVYAVNGLCVKLLETNSSSLDIPITSQGVYIVKVISGGCCIARKVVL